MGNLTRVGIAGTGSYLPERVVPNKYFEEFVETIHHSPNPEQPKNREIAGDAGTATSVLDGSGAMQGLKAYHIGRAFGPAGSESTCIHCHATPEGSNNRASLQDTSTKGTTNHPFETGALRHIFDREAIVRVDNVLPDDADVAVWTKKHGLFHKGVVEESPNPVHFKKATINDFMYRFGFGAHNPTDAELTQVRESLITFVRQLDTGTAPMIGQAYTFAAGQTSANIAAVRDYLEQVEEANAGLVIFVNTNGSHEGWWYDLESALFRRDGTASSNNIVYFLTQANTPGTSVVMQAVPVGSARRASSDNGSATILTGPAPSEIELLPMAPATHWTRAMQLVGSFGVGAPGPANRSLDVLRILQESVLGLGWGATEVKHQPPRRFRVKGDDIRHGAKLVLELRSNRTASMPLFPTKYVAEDGRRIWETSTELGSQMIFALMNGGPKDGDVEDVLLFRVDNGNALTPAADNVYVVRVVNEDGTTSASVTDAEIQIQDVR